jgi:UDP-N-acetylmuramoyl-tripeptide--D-alanyl-D-alanine ligase
MIALTLGEIAAIVDGVVHGDEEQVVSAAAFIDSRAPIAGGLFVAIEGEHADGHDYAPQAVAGGAAAVLGSRIVEGVACLVVTDPVEALGELARALVARLPDLTVIGITGSQGKTGTKDILAQLLERLGETVATAGSFNTEVGLPLTVLRATAATRYLVVEMGARGIGHIHYLTTIAQPSVGVVLNVGTAHIGEFGSKDETAVAKGELVEALPADGLAVLNLDDPRVAAMTSRTKAPVLSFGRADEADVKVSEPGIDSEGHAQFVLTAGGRSSAITLGLVGEHQSVNATAAAAVALSLGMPFDDLVAALPAVEPRSRWRMELTTTRSGVRVLNDAYNANPDSMRAALETLATLGLRHREGRTIAILGEMLELGETSRAEHEQIGRLASSLGITQLVVVGEGARPLYHGAMGGGRTPSPPIWLPDTDAAIAYSRGVAAPGDLVLVKASRAAGLEKVAQALLDEMETTA